MHGACVGQRASETLTRVTFAEVVRKLTGHVDFVKGVVWDPVGQYLATQVGLALGLTAASSPQAYDATAC